MSVKIRLNRVGKHKRPFYRIVVADSQMPRDGRFIEIVGTYDPLRDSAGVTLKQDRIRAWLAQGAQPSETVHDLFRKAGVFSPSPPAGA